MINVQMKAEKDKIMNGSYLKIMTVIAVGGLKRILSLRVLIANVVCLLM